jgi:DNA-binding transcriptional MerR regulator
MLIPTEREVPDREYFRIGEIAQVLGVPPSAIRFWKDTFPSHVRPRKTHSLQHVFSRRDLAVLALVRHLVHVEGLSIRDTKDRLSELLAQHGGDVAFIELAPPDGNGGGGVREAGDSRGFLAQLDDLRAELESVREARVAAESRARAAEAARDRAKAERDALVASLRHAVRDLADEADGSLESDV